MYAKLQVEILIQTKKTFDKSLKKLELQAMLQFKCESASIEVGAFGMNQLSIIPAYILFFFPSWIM